MSRSALGMSRSTLGMSRSTLGIGRCALGVMPPMGIATHGFLPRLSALGWRDGIHDGVRD